MPSIVYTSTKNKKKRKTDKQLRDEQALKDAAKALKDKWAKVTKFSAKNRGPVQAQVEEGPPKLTAPPGRTTTHHIKSLATAGGEATRKDQPVYTGTAMKGVATMHKSNSIPVFDDQHLVDISNMRRNDYTRDVKKK
jgi:hypothetical protein